MAAAWPFDEHDDDGGDAVDGCCRLHASGEDFSVALVRCALPLVSFGALLVDDDDVVLVVVVVLLLALCDGCGRWLAVDLCELDARDDDDAVDSVGDETSRL